MTLLNATTADQSTHAMRIVVPEGSGTNGSGVSWGAIFAGAAAAAALSLILLMLGIGLGLSSVSPWKYDGVSAATFGVTTIVWITLTQLIASGMGGYLAGRLRTKWVSVHTDEVYFRDTAHGLLAWAVATLVTAVLLTSVIGSIVGGGIQASAALVGGAASTAVAATASGAAVVAGADTAKSDGDAIGMGYFVDSLFRKDTSEAQGAGATTMTPSTTLTAVPASEVTRIFMNTIRAGAMPAEDVRYLGQVVAQRTGLSQPDAEKRVTQAYARVQTKLLEAETVVRDAADKGRKASSYAALWLFISLLIGAFVASLSATYGGRQRDE